MGRSVASKRDKRSKRIGGSADSSDEMFIDQSMITGSSGNSNNSKKFATSAKVLHMNELQVVFHLPMAEAAVKLGVCSTVLKKICRRNGISRWPYRQIRKIDKGIEELEQSLTSKNDERVSNEMMSKINSLKNLRLQIIDNPEIDRSTELSVALNDKITGADDSNVDFGLNMDGSSLPAGGMVVNGVGVEGGVGMGSLSTQQTQAILATVGSGNSHILNGVNSSSASNLMSMSVVGTSINPISSSGAAMDVSSSNSSNHTLTASLHSMASGEGSGGGGGGGEMFPLDSYQPSNLKTVFPRDMINEEGVGEGYGFGGSLGLVDVSWNDNADPHTGMTLYRGEHYEWLASHAAVVRGGTTNASNGLSSNQSNGTNEAGGVRGNSHLSHGLMTSQPNDVMDGGPINDAIRTRQQNRISIDSGLYPILPSIDVTDVSKLAKPDLLVAIDSEAFGPFDTEECRAGITIW